MTSLASPQSTISSRSQSPSSKLLGHILGILEKGHPVPANDRVTIIKPGQAKDFDNACTWAFGPNITLNSLSIGKEHTPMSAPQLATALEVAHNLAPNYSLKKCRCYWYALIVFPMARKQTQGDESNECVRNLGKLWWIAPTHSADDDENVVQEEYDKALAQFQNAEDERWCNPEEACRLPQERATSFERQAEEERKRADEAGRREEEERKRADEATKCAADEMRRRLGVEEELRDMRLRINGQGKQ